MGLSQQQSKSLYNTEAYTGWGEVEAREDAKKKGIQEGNYSSGGYSGGSGGGSSYGNWDSFLQQQQAAQQAAIAPAIQQLQSQIPTIKANTATQVGQKQAELQPLQDRYKALLDQIKGTGQTSVNKQTVVTANELGKRGIEGSSTLAGQEIASATLPIEQQTQSLVQDTGFAQEADIRDINNSIQNLGISGGEREQAIAQAIAQLQAGGGQSAISNAMQLLANSQNMQASQASAQSAQRQQDIENALNQMLAENTIKNTNSLIAERGSNSSSSNNIGSYYTTPGVTNVVGTQGNYQSQAGGQVLPQAKSFKPISSGASRSW